MAKKLIIQGGKPLKGEIEARGAKNAALPIIAAALLTKEACVIENLPLIEDVFKMLKIVEGLGGEISWLEKRTVKIKCGQVNPEKIPWEIVGCFRGSILTVGPLLSRFNRIRIPSPGGCLIGVRAIDTHLDAFSQSGVSIGVKDNVYSFKKAKKAGKPSLNYDLSRGPLAARDRTIILREFSVTATENMMLFHSFGTGKRTIKIADQDYQVKELAKALGKMGVGIKGVGTHTLDIKAAKKLRGFKHTLMSDPIEAGTFIVAALATKGQILIKNAELSFLELFLKRLKDFGANFEILSPRTIKVLPSKNLIMDKIQSMPYPGIHSDLQPELGVLATQTKGPTLIHDPLYEGRLKYLEELNKMGADIIFCDPHRAIIAGPTPLQGIEIPSLDIRAGAALVIAGLVAKGKTVLHNVYQIDRGYERVEERLQNLGADIIRV